MTSPPESQSGWPNGWDEHRREQATLGLRLTPAERLRWLEETMATMRRWVGLARPAAASSDPRAAEPVEPYGKPK